MDKIKLEIVTPMGEIFSDDIKYVTLPGSEGEFGVLPGHASLVSLLSAGIINIEKIDGKNESVAINWGYSNIDETHITVLAEGAVCLSGSDESEIAQRLQKAKKLLDSIANADNVIASARAKVKQ